MKAKLSLIIKPLVAVLLTGMLMLASAGIARADPCNEKGQPYVAVSGPPGGTIVVYANGQKVGQTQVQQQAGSSTGYGYIAFGEPFVKYDIVIKQVAGTKEVEIGKRSITCRPVGNQGQESSGNPGSKGNAGGNGGYIGDPISTSIGEYTFEMPLLNLGGPLPLEFTLYYASSIDKRLAPYSDTFDYLGDSFVHNYSTDLWRENANSIRMLLPYGNRVDWQKVDDQWRATNEEVGYQLQEIGDNLLLLDPIAERVYTFKKDRGVFGGRAAALGAFEYAELTRIEDRNGNALSLAQMDDGLSIRIDDGLGRTLTLQIGDLSDRWVWRRILQATDQTGRTIKFGYQVDTTSPVWTMHLTRVTDALGATTVFTNTGPLTNTVVASVMQPRGNVPFQQAYQGTGDGWRVTSQTDALGNATQLRFDDKGVATITDPLGNLTQHTHTDGIRLSALKDAAGKTATLEYDAQGRRIAVKDRMGDTTKFGYHAPSGRIASITNARGETVTFTYMPQEQVIGEAKFTFYNLTRVDYPDKTNAQFVYDAKGNIVSATDRAGQTSKYTYNARGQVLTETNPAGGVTTYTYNDDATLGSQKDSDGVAVSYAYDALKRLTKITDAAGLVANLTYDAMGHVTSYTDGNNRVTKCEYDANGSLVKITDAVGQISSLSYDALDRLNKATDRLGKSSTQTYDALGRVASTADATGIATQYGYDPRGWLTTITRGESAWQTNYDDEGIPVSVTTPLGGVVKLQNDQLGRLNAVTDPLGDTATLTRDALNRVTSVTDPLKRTTRFGYDAHDLLESVTLPDQSAAKYERDARGNLTRIVDLDGSEWKFAYTPMGRVQSKTDPLGKTTGYAYDERGRTAKITYPDGVTQAFAYDAADNITQIKYSDGTEFTYAYDAVNRLVDANGTRFTYDAEGRIISSDGASATYDDAGRLKTTTYGNLTVTYVYDPKTGLLASVSDNLTKTRYDFTYDKARQLVGIARSNNVNTTLTWDEAGRLTRLADMGTGGSPIVDAQYTLDAAGQVIGAKITAPLDPASALVGQISSVGQISNLSYNPASQISSTGYTYDARGRLTQSPARKFTWDGASRLVGYQPTASSQPSTVALTYNGLGDMVSRVEGNTATRCAYNYALGLAPIVAETDGAKPLRYHVWSPDGALLYSIDVSDGNKVYHYHFDRAGSTLALTDASGAVTDAYAYDPYGRLLAHRGKNAQPFTFVGKWGVRQDDTDGTLYQMRARYYDATTARFLSREPVWTQIDDPRLINPYQYALSDPLDWIDPTGLEGGPTDTRSLMEAKAQSSQTALTMETQFAQYLKEEIEKREFGGWIKITQDGKTIWRQEKRNVADILPEARLAAARRVNEEMLGKDLAQKLEQAVKQALKEAMAKSGTQPGVECKPAPTAPAPVACAIPQPVQPILEEIDKSGRAQSAIQFAGSREMLAKMLAWLFWH